jgi:hypothetical protein
MLLIKNLFTANGCWAGLLETGGLRDIEVELVSKMLACGTSILGVKPAAAAISAVPASNICAHLSGRPAAKKVTDQWIAVPTNRLTDCAWYHLPETLWPLFFHNRGLLDALRSTPQLAPSRAHLGDRGNG